MGLLDSLNCFLCRQTFRIPWDALREGLLDILRKILKYGVVRLYPFNLLWIAANSQHVLQNMSPELLTSPCTLSELGFPSIAQILKILQHAYVALCPL